ncbi:MAG: MazG-like family protein [Clostridiales bacterium]|nr:MazG-like family protein [Clostridiales bacterium]
MDITANIRIIEMLKTELLKHVADLHEALLKQMPLAEREELLSRIVIDCYMLTRRIGGSYEQLDNNISDTLRLMLLDGKEPSVRDAGGLIKFFESR